MLQCQDLHVILKTTVKLTHENREDFKFLNHNAELIILQGFQEMQFTIPKTRLVTPAVLPYQ